MSVNLVHAISSRQVAAASPSPSKYGERISFTAASAGVGSLYGWTTALAALRRHCLRLSIWSATVKAIRTTHCVDGPRPPSHEAADKEGALLLRRDRPQRQRKYTCGKLLSVLDDGCCICTGRARHECYGPLIRGIGEMQRWRPSDTRNLDKGASAWAHGGKMRGYICMCWSRCTACAP